MNIYVGNLSYNTSDDDLKTAFAAYGEVTSTNIIQDRDTGRSKGFAFIEMTDDASAEKAIEALNETELAGRNIKVNQARPKTERPKSPRY